VDRGPIRVAIAATGNLKAVITVDVGSQLSGQISSVEGDFNQRVAKDQAIAHIDPATFQARVTQAQADLTSAEASAQAARARAPSPRPRSRTPSATSCASRRSRPRA
jgi:HlyD family secretion protein